MSIEERIKKNFEDHIATISQFAKLAEDDIGNDVEVLTWKKLNSCSYMVRYIVSGNTLCVYGDLGEAIYRWSANVTLNWMASLDLSYFAGKCCASEVGRDFREWNEEKALKILREFEQEEYFKWSKFEESGGEMHLYNAEDWKEWLREHGYSVLGEDFYEWAYDAGYQINTRCVYHFVGLQMAMKQIAEKANIVE